MDHTLPFSVRKSPRIQNYDYSSTNYYFITICAKQKKCLFGTPSELNWIGKIVQEELEDLESHYDHVKLDVYIVMPNHIHGILVIESGNGKPDLSRIVGLFKSGVSRRVKKRQPDAEIWQRSYHDHIIRNQASYEKIWNYVKYNDQKWEADCFHPANIKP